MTHCLRIMTIAVALAALPATGAFAEPRPAQSESDTLGDFERKADELSETARRTIEEFVNLVGPMISRLSRLIDGLPTYEAPEILPNGDIIIRRKPAPVLPDDTDEDGLTET